MSQTNDANPQAGDNPVENIVTAWAAARFDVDRDATFSNEEREKLVFRMTALAAVSIATSYLMNICGTYRKFGSRNTQLTSKTGSDDIQKVRFESQGLQGDWMQIVSLADQYVAIGVKYRVLQTSSTSEGGEELSC
jgi:hypothetical protein